MSQEQVLSDFLQEFVDRNLIEDVMGELKSGKEAVVYQCRAHANLGRGLVAAKVHKPIEHRSFKNDGMYRAGRVIRSGRLSRALANKSEFGREIQYQSWIYYEWETLNHVSEIGADVPRPIAVCESAILMEFIGDENGPAPQLRGVRLSADAAIRVFDSVMRNVELLLAHNRIHGDLSPFNILYHAGRPVLIDFPQSVDPRENPRAYELLSRDIENVWRYCSKFVDLKVDPWKLSGRMWDRFLNARL